MKLNQSGMVLLVALVMVGLMSIIAVAAIRGSNMQEAMAGNLRDRNLAFQSAEAGLRIGEANVEAGATFGDLASGTGFYTDILADGDTSLLPIEWTPSEWNGRAISAPDNSVPGVIKQPQIVHEELDVSGVVNIGGAVDFESMGGSTSYRFYRITSRATGLTENTQVILQSTFVASEGL